MKNEKQKICAVICEFNPFHEGHAHLVKEIKALLPDYRLVAIMSGDFVQRAEPAIFDKYFRTEIALKNGFSAVVQIPTLFSTASAELFAASGIDIALNVGASVLAFGCETPSSLLEEIAAVQLCPTENFTAVMKTLLDAGAPYATALTEATQSSLNNSEVKAVLSKPNNVLAIEYLKANKKRGNLLQTLMIQRQGNDYNDKSLSDNSFPSATALREVLKKGENACKYFNYPLPQICDYALFDKIATANLKLASCDDLSALPDCTEGLEFKLKKNALKYNSLEEIIINTKTKRYTYARLKRIILQLVLGIRREDYKMRIYPAKVLGFIKDEHILGNFKKPVFVKNSEYKEDIPRSLEIDNNASVLAALLLGKSGNPLSLKPVIL